MAHVQPRARAFVLAGIVIVFILYFMLTGRTAGGQVYRKDAATIPGQVPATPGKTSKQIQSIEQDIISKKLGNVLPRKIWQIFMRARSGIQPSIVDEVTLSSYWVAMNPDYQYQLMSNEGAYALLQTQFAEHPWLAEAFNELTHTAMMSDLLRYMLMYAEGGVYSDIDTVALRPIDEWIPKEYNPRIVLGIEADRLDGERIANIPHDVSICPWTMAAVPGHPLFFDLLKRAVAGLREQAAIQGVKSLADLHTGIDVVVNMTGPAALTDVVFQHLKQQDSSIRSEMDLSRLTKPRLIGDILILPVDSFAMGMPHSGSTADGTIPESALVQHMFWGSWKTDEG